MILINAGDGGLNAGLGKAKGLKKLSIKKISKQVSIKNAVKAVKFAAPIAAGFIPVGGGVASKLMNSKAGKAVSKVAKSKAVKKVTKVSKTKMGKAVVSKAKAVAKPKLQALKAMTAATIAKTPTPVIDAPNPYANDTDTNSTSTTAKTKVLAPEVLENTSEVSEPVGELTPVTPVNDFVATTTPTTEPKASNTMLYVGGAIAVAGIAYLATKKSK